MPSFQITPGPLAAPLARATQRLERSQFADALWQRRLDAWETDEGTRQRIANRLGWVTAIDVVAHSLPRLRDLAAAVRAGTFTDVVLLGMGGSSLAPEVLRRVLGVASGYPRFRMLDSVDPEAVREALERASTSLFVLASKSGGTIEPNVMAAEARRRVLAAGETQWGSRVIAITDEGTDLHRRAVDEHFREIFLNPADIGGRYSALSFFGMVPAALMGADVERIGATARDMEQLCRRSTVNDNPGLALGALMAAGAASGRDKLTLHLPPALASFGLWVEQLVAESTGKQGNGVVPITGEPHGAPIGADRLFVSVTLGGDGADDADLGRARAEGVPIVEFDVPDVYAIGAEFLRWEVATAAAGMLLGINPFDEPNVQQAKDATRALLDGYRAQQRLPIPEPHGSLTGARLTLSHAAMDTLSGAPAEAFLGVAKPPDYFGLLAYLPPEDSRFDPVLQEFRGRVAARTGCATMFGYGPRYLHSTGQLHKGGANTGVFLIVTADVAEDVPIPGEAFSFGTLEMAQAVGDFQSLDRAARRVLHVRLPRRDPDLLRHVLAALLNTTTS
jgi:glucose-6-phosphate isomerase